LIQVKTSSRPPAVVFDGIEPSTRHRCSLNQSVDIASAPQSPTAWSAICA